MIAKTRKGSLCAALLSVSAVFLCIAASDGAWLKDVPDVDRQKVNPYAGQKDAIAAGNRIFLDKCAKCHGDDGTGRKKKPSLRTDRVQHATKKRPTAKFSGSLRTEASSTACLPGVRCPSRCDGRSLLL